MLPLEQIFFCNYEKYKAKKLHREKNSLAKKLHREKNSLAKILHREKNSLVKILRRENITKLENAKILHTRKFCFRKKNAPNRYNSYLKRIKLRLNV